MSYDIQLNDAITGEVLTLETSHQMKGGTYRVGGNPVASINITYNYGKFFYNVFGESGIRSLYGTTGCDSIPILRDAIDKLGNDISDNYWDATEGNAKESLIHLLTLAKLQPDGVWAGD